MTHSKFVDHLGETIPLNCMQPNSMFYRHRCFEHKYFDDHTSHLRRWDWNIFFANTIPIRIVAVFQSKINNSMTLDEFSQCLYMNWNYVCNYICQMSIAARPKTIIFIRIIWIRSRYISIAMSVNLQISSVFIVIKQKSIKTHNTYNVNKY